MAEVHLNALFSVLVSPAAMVWIWFLVPFRSQTTLSSWSPLNIKDRVYISAADDGNEYLNHQTIHHPPLPPSAVLQIALRRISTWTQTNHYLHWTSLTDSASVKQTTMHVVRHVLTPRLVCLHSGIYCTSLQAKLCQYRVSWQKAGYPSISERVFMHHSRWQVNLFFKHSISISICYHHVYLTNIKILFILLFGNEL